MTEPLPPSMRGLSDSRPALAVILARAGSKGVPGKNRAPVAGKPCVRWTIDHALASTAVGLVVVSTDDPAIIDIARTARVLCARRSEPLAGDTATVDSAARECLAQLRSADLLGDDHALAAARASTPRIADPRTPIAVLYGNVPVRPANLTDRALRLLISTACDSVQSYAPVGKHHPWWTARLDSDSGAVRPWEGDILNHNVFRRQDLPPAYIPDGGTLCVTRRALQHEIPGVPPGPHAFFGLDRRGVRTAEGEVIDIDSHTDLLVADALLRKA